MSINTAAQPNYHPELIFPEKREFKGGDLLAQCLAKLGVEVAFGIHGGHLDAFLMGAHDTGIRLVDTRHETAAVQAAEGYSKVKNDVGVCFVTANSGFGNGIPGLATAFADRSSIFCITSSSPQRDAETNVLQGFHDQVVLSKPVTRFAYRVVHAEEIPRLVSHAFHVATASPPGPALVDFPIEVLFSPVDVSRISWGSLGSPRTFPAGPHPEAIQAATQLLRAAKRPVVVTGTGARSLEGDKTWLEFIERTQIPVFNSMKYSSPLPFDHPLRAGVAHLLSVLTATGQASPDLVILLGARTGMFLGSRSNPCVPQHDCRYIQIDVDLSEIGRTIPVDVGITSDACAAISALAVATKQSAYKVAEEWTKLATGLKTVSSPHEEEAENFSHGKIHPYHALKQAFSALPAGALISIDGGECGSWTGSTSEYARPHRIIFSCGYLGFLGNGWGYCLGASVAEPDRLIVNIQGDGSAGFHMAELDTYARFSSRILTIVCNNNCWGMSTGGQELIYGHATDARPTASLSPAMEYSAIARGMNCESEKVDTAANVGAATEKLVKSVLGGKPALLELLTSSKPIHPGTVAMVGNANDPNLVVIPYYDNVPRAHYK